MRILVISDIHGNHTALQTVLSDAGPVDAVWCLGDIVGYGPDPEACVQTILSLPNLICILGNHDAAAVGKLDVITFNPEARYSIQWARKQLSDASIKFIESLPQIVVKDHITLTHGSPRSPIFEYLLDTYLATTNFGYFTTDYCLIGHTHIPSQFIMAPGDEYAQLIFPLDLGPKVLEKRCIINPGSTGQPRDRDPRASYALFDPETNTWDYRRVEYDIPEVQRRMRKVQLPERHVVRLAEGW